MLGSFLPACAKFQLREGRTWPDRWLIAGMMAPPEVHLDFSHFFSLFLALDLPEGPRCERQNGGKGSFQVHSNDFSLLFFFWSNKIGSGCWGPSPPPPRVSVSGNKTQAHNSLITACSSSRWILLLFLALLSTVETRYQTLRPCFFSFKLMTGCVPKRFFFEGPEQSSSSRDFSSVWFIQSLSPERE